ncbi:MAG: hypothetical protein HWD59_08075 [Coxiellaceae bacterium]|nr:MAG: hypothetical protein HWD59_08075 [Coxiellaceae bacterium]
MRKIFILMAVCLVVAVLSSCQLLRDNRKQQTIYVITSPTGASCQLSNDKGVWKVDATPQTIKIVRSMYGLTVICRKPGYVATTGVVTAKAKMFI